MTRKKVSVLTWTYRPGYIDNLVDSLASQTMERRDFEWILVDDLYPLRAGVVANYVLNRLDYKHYYIETGQYQNAAVAFNYALKHAEGELLYLMADYMYIHPSTLERHWDIYQRYGPELLISGPLMDGINIQNVSVHSNVANLRRIEIGGQKSVYEELTPPIDWPAVDETHVPTANNLLTIWKRRFTPQWGNLPMDWRGSCITKKPLSEFALYENYDGDERWSDSDWLSWYWCGRNDSVPRAMLQAIGGLEEGTPRTYGADSVLARRLLKAFPKMRYLVDTSAPAYMLPHSFRKGERPS